MADSRRHTVARYVAVHEAGHVVARWYTGTRFDRVWVRSRAEEEARPRIDDEGHEHFSRGQVEQYRRSVTPL